MNLDKGPQAFHGESEGCSGSGFVRSAACQRPPLNHVWQAARYNAPGMVAHESAKRGGELLKIPDFGLPPPDRPAIAETRPLQP
jgi:hypothetical protein